AGEALPPQLVAGKARQVDVVLRVVARIWAGLDGVHEPPAPAELHGPDADHVHLRLVDLTPASLDEHAVDSAPPELAGEGEADRSATHHQHAGRGVWSLPSNAM